MLMACVVRCLLHTETPLLHHLTQYAAAASSTAGAAAGAVAEAIMTTGMYLPAARKHYARCCTSARSIELLMLLCTLLLQHHTSGTAWHTPGQNTYLWPACTKRLAKNCPNVPKPTIPIVSCLSFDSLCCILCSKSNGCAASRASTCTFRTAEVQGCRK
jgi:hypothetical protein